ncbi:hypothetical protein CAEBREN_18564 [Caenorhabditis brenneri]|uniref:Large ribosomal subunit protein P2 n=1 Tax=Caenorhabditis brenneri TaxID=135651 RepID=G0NE76_CAEBE|nr:hypothetical protein CAEBREN_18564 [Caenorhabditis brenneri]
MRYISAYLLSAIGGNASPQAEDVKKIIQSIGADVDEEKVNAVVSAMQGKTLSEVITEGKSKLAAVPSGEAAPTSKAQPPADSKPAKKEEQKEESDDDMGFGLFD